MSNTNTGGPAFPTPKFDLNEAGQLTSFSVDTDGMTLRDYFAAKAMQGLVERNTNLDLTPHEACVTSVFAYQMADAMLEARDA
jgi:hypothetical protein